MAGPIMRPDRASSPMIRRMAGAIGPAEVRSRMTGLGAGEGQGAVQLTTFGWCRKLPGTVYALALVSTPARAVCKSSARSAHHDHRRSPVHLRARMTPVLQLRRQAGGQLVSGHTDGSASSRAIATICIHSTANRC
jgi:hypothetical protein